MRRAACCRQIGAAASCIASLLFVLATSSGCYVLHLARGQLAMVNGQVPIAEAVKQEENPTRRALLEEVDQVTTFAADYVKMGPSRSYVGYYAVPRPWLTLVLSAAPRDQLVPYTRWYPFAGRVPYRSYFNQTRAERAQAELEQAGYDTYLHHSPAYSTLGAFRDPVTSPMLDRGPSCPARAVAKEQPPQAVDPCRIAGLAETLIHELTHQHLYVPGHTDFNERLASFVGRTAVVQYLVSRGLYDDELRTRLAAAYGRQRDFEEQAAAAAHELDALYASSLPKAQKLARREPIFARLSAAAQVIYPDSDPDDWVMNNARILQYRRYDRSSDDMTAMWSEAHHDWQAFWILAQRKARSL